MKLMEPNDFMNAKGFLSLPPALTSLSLSGFSSFEPSGFIAAALAVLSVSSLSASSLAIWSKESSLSNAVLNLRPRASMSSIEVGSEERRRCASVAGFVWRLLE